MGEFLTQPLTEDNFIWAHRTLGKTQPKAVDFLYFLESPKSATKSFGIFIHQGHTKIVIIINIAIAITVINNKTIISVIMMMMTKTRTIYQRKIYLLANSPLVYPPHTMKMMMMMMMVSNIMISHHEVDETCKTPKS